MRSAVIFCLLALMIPLLNSCGEKEKKRRTTGYKGEARSNAFLAAQRLLEKRHVDIEQRNSLGSLNYNTSTVFISPSSLNTAGRAKRVMEWVASGGHLVFMIEGGEKIGNDFQQSRNSWSVFDEESSGVKYVFEQLGVEIVGWETVGDAAYASQPSRDEWEEMEEKDRVLLGSESTKLLWNERQLTIHHWAREGLNYELVYTGDMGSGDDSSDQHRFLSVIYGSGRVTLLSDASPFRNRYIGYADHAQFLLDVVDLSRSGTVVFTNGSGEGFFSMLWRYFWMAVIGILVAVVFWLWKNMPRFGPVQDLPDSNLREFSGQVRGIGRFLWQHKRDDAMLGALRRNINRKLALVSGEQHGGIFEQLSNSTDLPIEQVIEAMTREQIREPGAMVRVTRNLQKIYQQIN